jgi:ribonuclease-3
MTFPEGSTALLALEVRLGLTFKDKLLLRQALTHRSTGKSLPDGSAFHNQRLEFLGDSVLGLVIAEMLYRVFPKENEGDLSKRLVALVNGQVLSEIARELQLGEAITMAASEAEHGGRDNASNLEDACEAIIGAIFLDQGLDAAREFISRHWAARLQQHAAPPKDPKTSLQEWAQARGLKLPEYLVVREAGSAHAPQFTIELRVEGLAVVQATAGNKKQAEREAAEKLLQQLPR